MVASCGWWCRQLEQVRGLGPIDEPIGRAAVADAATALHHQVISSRGRWFVTTPHTAPTDVDQWVRARIGASGFRVDLDARRHHLVADEPRSQRGTDAGVTPYEMVLGALAACTAMTLRMYADRKEWPVEAVVVWLRQSRSHELDCESCETEKVGMGAIERRVELTGALSDEQRARLLEIADRCPVKQTLERGITVG